MSTIEGEQLAQVASQLGWTVEEGKLHLDVDFPDFSEAFAFLTQVALLAHKQNHHPELYNSFNEVEIDLVSHDAGGVTERDVELAKLINQLVGDAQS